LAGAAFFFADDAMSFSLTAAPEVTCF